MAGSTRIVKYVVLCDSSGAIVGMKRVEESADKVSTRLQATGSHLKSLGGGMSSFGHKLTSLSVPLLAVGAYSVKMAMNFNTSMTQLQTQAGASAKEVKKLEGAVFKLGPKIGEGPKELADALYPIRSVGLKGAQAMQALTASAKGAQIGGSGLTETADALSGALRTNMKDVKSASGAMDIMNKVVGLGKLHLTDLTQAFSTGILPAAKTAGLGFRDVGAALDAMTAQGIPASVEATRLRTNLSQFEAPHASALKALRSIGLGQYTLAEDLRKPKGLIVALTALKEHLSTVGKNEQGNILARAFGGARGSANVAGLLNSLTSMTSIRAKLQGAGGKQFSEAWKTWEKTPQAQMDKALAAGRTALTQFGQVLIPIVIPALTKFSKLVIGGIDFLKRMPKPLKDIAIGFTIMLAIGGPLLIFFGNMISAVGSTIGMFGKLSGAFTKLGPALKGAATDSEAAGTTAFASLGTLLGAALVGGIIAYIATNSGPKWFQKLFGIEDHHTILHEAEQGTLWGLVHPNAAGPSEKEERKRLQHWEHHGGSGGSQGQGWRERGFHSAREAALAIPMPPIHTHITLQQVIDGKAVAQSTVTHIRHDPTLAKPVAEAVTKYAQFKAH
jgi:TP901 family phage tail tape measure protein